MRGVFAKMYRQRSLARLAVCAFLGGAAQRVSLRDKVSRVVTVKYSPYILHRHDLQPVGKEIDWVA